MAENLTKKPAKGILKHSKSLDQHDINRQQDIKWDEMNILQTLHPADKDYGHMKIDEPKTPYNYYKDEVPDNEKLAINPALLAEKIQQGAEKLPKVMTETSSSEEETETEEERAKRKLFEHKRKTHYNEYYAVKLARKLMSADEDEDEDDEEDENNSNVESNERHVENKNSAD